MKTRQQIIEQLATIKEPAFSSLKDNELAINFLVHFYHTYPQYEALDAFGAHIVNVSLKYHSVGVWKFSNGDILFIGGVGSSKDPAPLASIGGHGLPLPADFKWTKPKTFLTRIEVLPSWNS